ncbi:MAG: DUF1826 domain-containing protein, partial [Myxococcaceae bacterium]|nr:DUF1826 domain-containing protein [Myxococcaceae bacterium]
MTPAVDVSARPSVVPPLVWPLHARRGGALDALVDIYEPALNLVTAPLDADASVLEVLTRAASEVPCFEFVKETSGAGALEHALPWFEGHAGGPAWLGLAQPLVGLFADLFEAERLGVRLTLADKPMCPRFHVDDVVCRLVVTLVGRGSEFLGEPDVRRKLLGAKESSV